MSSEIALSVSKISKVFKIYSSNAERLKDYTLPFFQRALGKDILTYGRQFTALSDINFHVEKGESFGIVGKNGSGKSTLLQIICGTMQPTSGTISCSGRISALLELGSGFNPEFTGLDNIFLNGSLLNLSRKRIEDKIDEILSFADIGDFIHQPVKIYSSGMMVRLAFAVQAFLDPDILIVDEALAVGDALFQKRCYRRIEKLLSDGVTLLFVSHDQEMVRTVTRRGMLLQNGTVRFLGASSDVILEYRKQLQVDELNHFKEILKEKAILKNDLQHLDSSRLAPTSTHQSNREDKEFGYGGVEVIKAETLNDLNELCSIFYSGDTIRFRLTCKTYTQVSHLNVGIRIRNKEGVKIYSWGTLNQDMRHLNTPCEEKAVFWQQTFLENEEFYVVLEAAVNLGQNLYEVQTCVSIEETPDYMNQHVLHWKDEACFFQVHIDKEKNFFGGILDMGMVANWSTRKICQPQPNEDESKNPI